VIPAEFTGGWERISIAVDGGPSCEDMTVWWLQSVTKHADLRVPLAPGGEGMAFAGTTRWQAPSLTWLPDLEWIPSGELDTGAVSWDGDDLLEAGTTTVDGREVSYVERWRRMPDSAAPLLAMSRPGGRLVRTGALALTIVDERDTGGTFTATARRRVDGAWTVAHRWPADGLPVKAPQPPPPPLTPLRTASSVVLDDGALWTVDEHSADETHEIAVTHG